MKPLLRVSILLLGLGLLAEIPNAEAVQIKRVQRGTLNFDIDDVLQASALTYPVNQSKSLILLTNTGDANNNTRDQNWFFIGQFEDSSNIQITRGGGTSPASVAWEVVEFEDGVNIQRGISSMQAGTLTKSLTLPAAVDSTKAVPIVYTSGAFTTTTQTHELFLLPSFTDSQTLKLDRLESTGTKAISIAWQVIEFLTDATVQTGTATLPVPGVAATNQTATATVSALSSAGANALLFTYFVGDTGVNGIDATLYTRGTVTDGTTLTFTRGNAPTTALTGVSVRYYVVDLTDGTSLVQKGTVLWSNTIPLRQAIGSVTTGTPIVVSITGHGYTTGERINISGQAGEPAANGSWVITVIDANSFSLDGSVTSGLAGDNTGRAMTALPSILTNIDATRTLALGRATTATTGTTNTYADDLSFSVEIRPNGNRLASLRATIAVASTAIPAVVQYFAAEFAPLTLKSPNGAEVWKVGEVRNIVWKHAESLNTGGTGVGGKHLGKLELSRNSGGAYLVTAIATGIDLTADAGAPVAGEGSYAWTLPAAMDLLDLDIATLRVKVTDTDMTVRNSDASNADFEIKGTLTLTVPNTNVTWFVGDSCPGATCRTITWTRTGNLDDNGTVTLKLYTGSGAVLDSTIATLLTPSSGSYNWTPTPDKIRSDLRVGIELTSDLAGVNDKSDVDFTIKGRITVTTPNGPQTPAWEALKTYNITWTSTGTLPPGGVDIFYSKNSGGSYSSPNGATIATGAPATGTYAWTVPTAAIGSFTRIKVQQNGDATTFDESDADSAIVASITVTSPTTGAEVWKVGEANNITWTINGTGITNVKIEYSTDGGASYNPTPIVASTPASSGSYPWTIPDAIGNQTKVKISNVDNLAFFDASDNNFTIKGKVTVAAPNGTEVWTIGSSRVITWTTSGTLSGNVEIRYSTDGGTNYPNLLSSTTLVTALSYTWNPIPDMTSGINNAVKVKVALASDLSGVFDESNADFSIKGTLSLTAPNGGGGQSFVVAATTPISWTKTGSIGSVELRYSTDSGGTFPAGKVIASGLDPVTGTPYTWTLPDDISGTARVKVQLVADTSVADASDADFAIKGSLDITAPDGGEVWKVGESRLITWTRVGTTGTMTGNVKLEYSTDGGTNYPNLINNTTAASALSYNWTIPDAIGNSVRVKITLLGDASVSNASAANFSIKGILAVTAPNGTEVWIVGATQNITWTRTGTVANVKLEYSTNAFANELQTVVITASTPADPLPADNAGTYAWTLPDAIGSTVKVRVSDVLDSTVLDLSDANFTIKGSLTLTAPNGSEVWIVGSSQSVTWTKTGSLTGNVKLVYSTDGGVTYPEATPNNVITTTALVTALSFAWTIPDSIGNFARVRVVYLNDTTVSDDSNANFSIKGSLTLTVPDSGEIWAAGTTQSITWTKSGTLADLKLEYSTDAGATYPNLIIGSTPAANLSYSWAIPAGATLSATARVKATLLSDTAVADASNNNFRVRGNTTLTAPNTAVTWIVGATQNITWTIAGAITNVKLEYSKNAFADEAQTFTIVASTAAGALSYSWVIPDAIGSNLKVRVSDAADAPTNDVSDVAFTIKGSVTVTAPNGAETWIVGESRNITWTMTGTLGSVKLEYSKNGFSDELQTFTITASTAADTAPTGDNAGSFPWTIPDASGITTKVRASQVTDSTVNDKSDLDFTIKGSLTITAPNGAESWPINGSQNITWNKTGTLTGNLKLEYSTDGGVTYPVGNLISNTVAATAVSYAWTIPDNPSGSSRVKVTYLNDTSVNDQSDSSFSIKGSLFIAVPNGSEVWKVGEVRNITWTRGGSIANAKLDYSTDAGATYPYAIVASTPAANLSYAWTIPDSISNTARVRITDVGDATTVDPSDANFSIKGILTVTAPNGGETWIVNSVQNITWTKSGTIPNAKLEYSKNGFTDELQTFLIVGATPGANLTYAWTVPDAIGTSLKVRITNVDDSAVTDNSNANFTIKGSLALTSPNGAEVWIVNESRALTWTKQGSIANVKLEYSKNGFLDELQTFTIIASTAAAPLSYTWTVADAIGTALKVRVSDASDSTVNDLSNADFTIKGALVLTAPNGAETWTVLSSQNITWTRTGSITNVSLAYSTDGGSTFPNTIAASTDAAIGSYAWTIPDAIGDLLKVRVTNTANTTVFDDSNANFKIRGALTVTAPNGAEKWTVGTAENITWTRTGSVANAKLEYSTDGGTTFPNLIIATTPASALTYAWTIPNSPTATAKVRISDVADANVNDVSNANFKIKASLAVTVPNGGEVWTVGSSQNVTWTNVGTVANVKLEYSTDGGLNYPNLITASALNTGSYSWTIPDAISTSARVKVTDAADADASDPSNANFKIRGALTVTAPNGAEGWPISTTQNVTWTRVGSLPNVKLEYSTNGFADELLTVVIIASTPADPAPADNNGIYAWLIPDAPSSTAKVRVSDASDATVNDLSNANFSIKGSLTLTVPNGGEVWVVGNTSNITWTKLGAISNVKLEYSTDGGLTYPVGNLIISSTPAGLLSYSWTIPDAISTTVTVKVTDVGDGTVSDPSNANFKIRGSITVTSPNGSEVWIVGNSNNITWTRTGSFANVKLEYSRNGFLDELQTVLISASAPASPLSFAWTIPDAVGATLKVRASDAADSTVVDTSNADFEIKGSLTVTAPNGGEIWRVAELRNITWTKTGTIANVKLEYSTDGGTTYPNVITASTGAAAGTYAWTVPDNIGVALRVKVTHTGDATVNDASNANFEVKGSVTLTSPNGTEVWVVGATQNITWTRTGTFANVKLEYSTNAFANELQTTAITLSTAADPLPTDNAGTYAWTVPDAIGSTLRVRIGNTADTAGVVDTSDANFKIVGSVTLTAPNGDPDGAGPLTEERWTVASSQSVTWTKVGSIANVKLELSADGGTSYPTIIVASTAAAAGAYAWTIPDSIGTTRRVKVSDASDSTILDTSNGNFTVMGGFTISAPNGGEVWIVASAQSITWTTAGSVANVKLEYSTDGGTSYPSVIIATTANTGTYSWTVPDAITTLAKVRVSDAANANALDVSNGNFKIRGAVTVTAPNGGEGWGVATVQNIAWTRTGSIANVKLEYSTNGFTDELQTAVIVASTPADPAPADNAGTYAWTIPDAPSTTVKVRISDASDLTVLDLSNANFKIQGTLTLTAPNGTEAWIVGSSYNIAWTKAGNISSVKLQYSTDSGVTWPVGKVIIASTAADPPPTDNAGSYTWTIPDDISNAVRVRMSDVGDTSVLDDSNADFNIKGSVTVTAPNGTEVWVVATSQNITWTRTGTFANVKLEYSKNAFADELQTFLIIASTPADPLPTDNAGTYAWTIPDAISSTVKVRASNVADATVLDLSNANFSIKGSLTLTAPNGSEVWNVGSAQPVTWSKVGSIANVKLEYSTDGGVSYPSVIVASVPASLGSYGWTIPDAITTTARVKVTNLDDTAVNDASDANFKIAGSLTLTAPNGAEAWLIGGSQNITWNLTGSIANVKLEYSTDSGTTYPNLIVASTAADPLPTDSAGTYAWTIPDAPTTQARVKITNAADSTVSDASNANFNIRGSVTLTAPNGTEVWVVGESRNVTWTKTGSFSNVDLRYSTNSGTSYLYSITASTPAATLSYAWTVPDAISATLRVKVTDLGDAAVTDESNADFKIKGSVALTAPNGAEVWIVGALQSITWTKTGSFANVKLEYSTNGFADELQTTVISASAPAGSLIYTWTVPDAIGATLKVRVSDAADATVVDTSNANFTIKGSVTLTAPNGAEVWIVGASQNIAWTRTGSFANVKLEYSRNGFSDELQTVVITASTAADPLPTDNVGSYAWVIPDAIGNVVKVRVTNTSDATVADSSNAIFSIKGSFALTSPNGSELWIVGETRSITWTKTGSIANARLDYSTDGGVSYPNVITTSTPASNLAFTWTVPDNMSGTVKVKITDVSDTAVYDASDTSFKIAGSFTLTSPNGAEKWAAGSAQSITWTKNGTIVNAKLEFSTDGGATYPNLIVATTSAATLSYAWTLPSATSTTCKVKITDVADSTVFDASNANFKMMGGFTVTAPNGGEVLVVGSSQNITWTTVGSVANVKITDSVDGGTTFPNVLAASTPNTGSFALTMPDAIATTHRVKVEDVLDPDAFDTSNANFKIKGALTVVAPNAGEIWTVSSGQTISWTRTGSVGNIKIEYSTDGGVTYPAANLIVASTASDPLPADNAGTYAWTIPDSISTTCRVKVTELGDTTVFDESNANFTIRGSFTLSAPNGGEKWAVSTTQSIAWTTFGTIPNVKLEYSTDGGATYPNVITATVANTGTYSWAVPNALSATARVRVLNAADLGTLDASNANFKIMAKFTVGAPNGGEILTVGNSQSVTWTTNGTVSNVELKYSTDSGATYPNLVSASTPNSGTYAWTVPNVISATLRFRVADALDTADAFDASDADFKAKAGFNITAPNGGEAWIVGTTQNITWTTAGSTGNIKLEYSTDGGTNYLNVIAASIINTGSYAWVIPDNITASARVRVSDVNDSTANDASNTNFKIRGNLTVTAPNGDPDGVGPLTAEKWSVGSGRTISWDRVGSISFVKLEFSTDGGTVYSAITASTSNTGSYAWTVPDNISTNCLVKVTDTNDATVNDVSNGPFKIQAGFVLTAPNGGEVWAVGSSRTVTWTTNGTVSFVRLDYSLDGGTTYPTAITTSTSNLGTYSWTVPDAVSGTVKVKVSQTTDAEAFDESNGNFRIRSTLTLSSPNGAEQWRVGQSRNILWSVVGTMPNTKLQYSRDNFTVDFQTIAAAAPSTGSYAWTIPDSISNTVKVRVSDPNDVGSYDDSNADFRITGDFTLTAPNGAEQWLVGSPYSITWTKTGSVNNAKLELSLDGGGTYPLVIIGLTTNSGTYAWTVPDNITPNARVRISDAADATANDISDANFKIKAAFSLTAPNGGEVWTVASSQNITWTNTGTVPNVKLLYSTNSGAAFPNTILASTSNIGTYSWAVPDSVSTQVRVRVGSVTDADAYDDSNADFKIRGALVLTAPNGAEGYRIANTHSVTWTTTGTVPMVKLTYSTDGGVTYPGVVIASLTNTGSYSWLIPDVPSTTARVRVENTTDSTVYDDSNANFSLQGNFTLTAPNGGEVWTVAEVRNITWNWGGTIANVKLLYSTDGGTLYNKTVILSTPNGIGSSGSFSYAWTIPDDITTTVRVKIENPLDAAVFDTSDANFKIQGKLVMTVPNGDPDGAGPLTAERWVTNEARNILWITTGTVPNVKLEYSTDGGLTYPAGNVIAANTSNTGSYAWTIPNLAGLLTAPVNGARVRVSNAADSAVADQSNGDFQIDWYVFTWEVRDLLSNNHISNFSVTSTDGWTASGLASPLTRRHPYGTWTATLTHSDYGDKGQTFVAASNQTMVVYVESKVVHVWEPKTTLTYLPDPDGTGPQTDQLTIGARLTRDGINVSGATSCNVQIYDGGTQLSHPSFLTSGPPPAATNLYSNTWNGTTMASGKVYAIKTTVTISTGGSFTATDTFTPTFSFQLKQLEQTVNAQLDTPLSQVKTDILTPMQTKLDTQKASIDASMATQTALIDTKTTDMKNTITTKIDEGVGAIKTEATNFTTTVSGSIVSLETSVGRSGQATTRLEGAAVKAQDSAGELEKTGKKFSGRLLIPPAALIGDTVTLRYRGPEKLSPQITIFGEKDTRVTSVVKDAAMKESSEKPGLYEYDLKVTSDSFSPGKTATVFVQAEVMKGVYSLESGSFGIAGVTLDALQGLIASQNTKPLLQETLSAVQSVRGSLATGGDVGTALESLKKRMDLMPKEVAREGGAVEMKRAVKEATETIRTLAGNEGYNLKDLVKVGMEEGLQKSPTVKDVRKAADRAAGAAEVVQILMERKYGGVDEPVVHVLYE